MDKIAPIQVGRIGPHCPNAARSCSSDQTVIPGGHPPEPHGPSAPAIAGLRTGTGAPPPLHTPAGALTPSPSPVNGRGEQWSK